VKVLVELFPVLKGKQAAAADAYEVTLIATFLKMMDSSINFTSLGGRTVAGRELLEFVFGHVMPGLKLI